MKRSSHKNPKPALGASPPPVTVTATATDTAIAMATTAITRDQQWTAYCNAAVNCRPDELPDLQTEPVPDQPLLVAAVELVSGLAAAGVRRWDWLPAPSADDLHDLPAWVARRLADRRTEQAKAERSTRLRRKLARAEAKATGVPLPSGTGTINPVHLQKSGFPLAELTRRLRQAMSRPGFQREWLDNRSVHYVSVSDGGISNKQVTIMAGLITGRQEPRPFEETWAIVTDWLREQPDQAADQEAAQ